MTQPQWKEARRFEDVRYEKWQGIAKVTINRPEVRNAFRPQTLFELSAAFEDAREDPDVGVVILTGQGNDAFCSGGDQRIRGDQGYVGKDGVPRLNVLDLQKQIRSLPKPVVAMVAGYAIGGGHVLHVVCDLTIAADNARFGQTGPKVVASTADSALRRSPRSSASRRRRRSGSSAASTTRSRRCRWAWSTPSSRWRSSKRKR